MRSLMDKRGYGISLMACAGLLLGWPGKAMAVDVLGEYSYMHVSFSSVWHIFLFILVLVMMPFFLMIYHVWRHGSKKQADGGSSDENEGEE